MEDIRERIVESATTQFQQFGCKRITMDDVSNNLHISKRTLYEQFANKEELLRACISLMNRRIMEVHKQIENTIDSPLIVTIILGRMHEHYSAKYHLFISDLKKYYPGLLAEMGHKKTHEGESMMEKWLRTAAEKGYIRKEIDFRLSAEVIASVMEHFHSGQMPSGYNQMETINNFMGTYMRGLLTVEALAEFEANRDTLETELAKIKLD